MAKDTTRRRSLAFGLLASTLAAAVLAVPPVSAEPGDEVPQPRIDVLPSFAESPGCGALDGVRGPLVPESGWVPAGTAYYGPWADFYGRTKESVIDQLVLVALPNMSSPKALYVHERVLPSFEMVLDNLDAAAGSGLTYDVYSNQTFSVAYSTIRTSRHISFHTVGAALDVNSLLNPFRGDNVLITDMPEWFVDAWRDAGWCWGGDWQTIKDPMHYAWMGPIHTPGYVTPPPQDPIVGAADFTDEFDLGAMLPGDGAGLPELVADLDRDGAPDVVRIEPVAGSPQYVLRSAEADHAHETCSVTPTAVTPTDPSAPAYLKDLTGDSRPDLVYALSGGPTLAFEVFPMAQYAALVPEIRTSSVAPEAGDHYLFGDHDRDGHTDLYVVRDGDPAGLEIWRGPEFTDRVVDVPLAVPAAGHRFDLGDRAVDGHLDGIPDVYALDGDGRLVVHRAADGFAPADPIATGAAGDERLSVEDLDGDGHDDLLLTDQDGATRMLRGGLSTHHPGIWYEVTEDEWTPGSGCATPPPMCAGRVATLVGTPGKDVLYGNDLDNVIVSGDGRDTIWALGGDDIVCAGRHADTVYGGSGNDLIRGEPGPDRLEGGGGHDRIHGGGGSDILIGHPGRDRIYGGTRNDRIWGGRGNDRLRGSRGDDRASGGAGLLDDCDAETMVRCENPY